MDLTAAALGQFHLKSLLLQQSHSISTPLLSEEAIIDHTSFGAMMALMTAHKEDLDADAIRQHDAVGQFLQYDHDPYQVAVTDEGGSSAHDHLISDDQLVQAIHMACAPADADAELQLRLHAERPEANDKAEKTVDLRRAPVSAAEEIPKKCRTTCHKCRDSTLSHISEIASTINIVEREDPDVDVQSSALVMKEQDAVHSTEHAHQAHRKDVINKIVSHPDYRRLVMAYINCSKVGAPPDIVKRLEQLGEEYDGKRPQLFSSSVKSVPADPELDHFMTSYCSILNQYEKELSKPFNDAMSFFQNVKHQIDQLILRTSAPPGDDMSSRRFVKKRDERNEEEAQYLQQVMDDRVVDHEDEVGEVVDGDFELAACCCSDYQHQSEEKQLKENLVSKYRGYIRALKNEFMKKKKKGKLPKDARQCLLDWWYGHYKWPYPSELEKVTLAKETRLDQKQINNWFINQRKRHWKPCDQTFD